jgi:hypothetical protein
MGLPESVPVADGQPGDGAREHVAEQRRRAAARVAGNAATAEAGPRTGSGRRGAPSTRDGRNDVPQNSRRGTAPGAGAAEQAADGVGDGPGRPRQAATLLDVPGAGKRVAPWLGAGHSDRPVTPLGGAVPAVHLIAAGGGQAAAVLHQEAA